MTYVPHRYWEDRGRTYHLEDHVGEAERRAWVKAEVEDLRPESVLEAGCGNGRHLSTYLGSQRVAIDFSASMLGSIGNRWNTPLIRMSLGNLGFQDKSFDMSFTCTVLIHNPSIVDAVNELTRVTKKHILIIEFWDPSHRIGELDPHCFRHDYPKQFKINGWKLVKFRMLQASIGLFLFSPEGSAASPKPSQ